MIKKSPSPPKKTGRFTNSSMGEPVFVYVEDGRVKRVTPIVFDSEDAESWTIKARGEEFSPPRKNLVPPFVFFGKIENLFAGQGSLSAQTEGL